MKNCKKPTCQYSDKKEECVKPNAYLEFMAVKKPANAVKKEKEAKNPNLSSCPKPRRPINGVCNDTYPELKLNNYNVECCYKNLKAVLGILNT